MQHFLTTAFFIAVVLAVLESVAHLVKINALAGRAQVLIGGTGGMRCDTQTVRFVRAIRAVELPITNERRPNARPIAAGKLVGRACVIGTAQLVAAVTTVVHAVTAGGRE